MPGLPSQTTYVRTFVSSSVESPGTGGSPCGRSPRTRNDVMLSHASPLCGSSPRPWGTKRRSASGGTRSARTAADPSSGPSPTARTAAGRAGAAARPTPSAGGRRRSRWRSDCHGLVGVQLLTIDLLDVLLHAVRLEPALDRDRVDRQAEDRDQHHV